MATPEQAASPRGAPLDPPDPPDPPGASRLPLGVVLAYGAPGFANAMAMVPVGIHLTIFYTDTVLVPIGFIALVGAAARSIDALTDPLMGWITDHTRTRFGRRRPWIALGAPLCALAYLALFAPPAELGPRAAAVWFAACYVAYYLFRTVYSLAVQGLGAELSLEYGERNRLFVVAQAFGLSGTLLAPVLPLLLLRALGPRSGLAVFAAGVGGLLAVLYGVLVWRVRERPEFTSRISTPLVPGLRRAWRNRPFRILVLVQLVSSPYQAFLPLLPFLTKYVTRPESPDTWLMISLLAYFGSALAAMPAWLWAANRFGKKPVWLTHYAVLTPPTLALFFVGEGDAPLAAALVGLAGAGFGGGPFVLSSMTADSIDYDHLLTGKRRESQYAGLRQVIMKFVDITNLSMPLAVLASLGFAPNVAQTPTVELAIRAMAGLVPAASVVAAFGIACLYPIGREVHGRIWEGIRAREAGAAARDPLTGRILPPRVGADEDAAWFLDHFSARELRRVQASGPGAALRSAGTCVLLAVLLVPCAGLAAARTSDLGREPGLLALLFVVAAGLGITASAFHGLRLRAAWRLRRDGAPAAALRARLDDLDAAARVRAGPG